MTIEEFIQDRLRLDEGTTTYTRYRLVLNYQGTHQGVRNIRPGESVEGEIARLEARGYTIPRVQVQRVEMTVSSWAEAEEWSR